ncbi:MAG: hypothetical protein KJO98_02435 [Rhodothermia bacterium]|nr:hypothetical protein [Rhodothermia bacterium]
MDAPMMRKIITPSVLLVSSIAFVACGSSNRLAEYDFKGSTIAMVETIPPRPDVFSDDVFFVDENRPLRTAIRFGTRVIREVEARRLRQRLDSALTQIDVSALIADQTLDRSSVYLQARPVADAYESDFILDLRVFEYGIVAGSWTARAEFMIDARLMLLDGATGRRIWENKISAREPVRGVVIGAGPVANDIITAAILSSLSVEEIVAALEGLADFAADRLSARLQRDFIRSRE